MPRVSILLTCYNHLAYLPAAVEGIRAQTMIDWEVIAIDDGSTDGSREWLSAHAGDFTLIFTEQNVGTYAALNRALAHAAGDYIAVLNDDDVWLPTKLERQLEAFARHPKAGLAHTDGWFIDGGGNRLEGAPLGFTFPRLPSGDALPALLYANKIIASAALVRRSCFEELGGFDDAYFGSGDWEMWLRIAERHEVAFVDEPLTLYRVHGANASHKLERIWRDDERLREEIVRRAGRYAASGRDPRVMREALAHNWACLGTVRTLNGNRSGGRAAYVQSIRMSPKRLKSYLRWATTFLPRSVFRRLAFA